MIIIYKVSSSKSRTHLHLPTYSLTHNSLRMQISTTQQHTFKKNFTYKINYSIKQQANNIYDPAQARGGSAPSTIKNGDS